MTVATPTRSALPPILLMTLGMAAVVGAALALEYLGGYIPCELCLLQRKPYYIGLALGVAAILAVQLRLPVAVPRVLLLLLLLLFVVSAGLGVYHAGVEWKFWEGPSACAATAGAGFTGGGDILSQLNEFKGPACTEAALRVLGLSLAGWNVLTSLALAAIAWFGLRRLA